MDKENIQRIISELPTRVADVKSVLVATLDGITISDYGMQEDGSRIAAMTAAALGLGKRMVETIRAGLLDEISVAGIDGRLFIYAVGEKAVLVVVTKQSPNAALVNWEARKAILELSFVVGV